MAAESLRSEAYTALSGQPPAEIHLVAFSCEYNKLIESLHQAWRAGKTLKVIIQEVPK